MQVIPGSAFREKTCGMAEISAASIKGKKLICSHCGLPALPSICDGNDFFCCQGCKNASTMLKNETCSVAGESILAEEDLSWTDLPGAMAPFEEGKIGTAVLLRFTLPAIHCAACIQVLEKLYLRNPGIVNSEVRFLSKEILLAFEPGIVRPSALIRLLDHLGYPPDLSIGKSADKQKQASDRLLIRLAVAAFCAGNIMLLSFPEYLGLEDLSYRHFFSWLNLFLSLPAVLFSAWPYWNSVLLAYRSRHLNLDVPIAAGMFATFLLSLAEIISGSGTGYLDSLTGLILFLLAGRWVQDQTYKYLSFERDYRSYFPLSVIRRKDGKEMPVLSTEISPGDELKIRHGEIVPCDGILLEDEASIDSSFINGESEPVRLQKGSRIMAGVKLLSPVIRMEASQAMQRSQLVKLWNNPVFRKKEKDGLKTFSDQVASYFTPAVLAMAFGVALFWWFEKPENSLKSFVSVLIVACPCTLALAYPIAMGNTMRIWGKRGFFLKNAAVAEQIGRLNTLVFDKTGTLGEKASQEINYFGEELSKVEISAIASLCACSTHPLSVAVCTKLKAPETYGVIRFEELPGRGIRGEARQNHMLIGSAAFTGHPEKSCGKTEVHVSINGCYKGHFEISGREKPFVRKLIHSLGHRYKLALVSGDLESKAEVWKNLFEANGGICLFRQSPENKLKVMEDLRAAGSVTAMIGDGLNDAGALRAADCGIAIASDAHQFTPGSDAILLEKELASLPEILKDARRSIRVVKACFALSLIYNAVGFSVAASGSLSPLFAAILMPASSVTVVLLAWAGTSLGLSSGRQ